MAKTVESNVVTEAVCSECGTDVRDGSEYCYNCGHSTANAVSDIQDGIDHVEATQHTDNGFQNNGPGAIRKEARLRQRSKRPVRPASNEPIQVVWGQRQDSGVGFLIVSLVAGGIALLLIFIAYYLK